MSSLHIQICGVVVLCGVVVSDLVMSMCGPNVAELNTMISIQSGMSDDELCFSKHPLSERSFVKAGHTSTIHERAFRESWGAASGLTGVWPCRVGPVCSILDISEPAMGGDRPNVRAPPKKI